MAKIDLSVIVPVYNLEEWIKPLLDSLKIQKIEDYTVEYIFVDNNCTDNTVNIIKDSGIECQILRCEIQGCGAARNVGFEASIGEYIWFLDGDDWLATDTAIKDALDKIKGDHVDMILVGHENEYKEFKYFSMVWQYVFRREFIAEFRFPDIQPSEDDAYMDMVLAKCGLNRRTYVHLPKIDRPLYHHMDRRPGSNMYRFLVLGEKI